MKVVSTKLSKNLLLFFGILVFGWKELWAIGVHRFLIVLLFRSSSSCVRTASQVELRWHKVRTWCYHVIWISTVSKLSNLIVVEYHQMYPSLNEKGVIWFRWRTVLNGLNLLTFSLLITAPYLYLNNNFWWGNSLSIPSYLYYCKKLWTQFIYEWTYLHRVSQFGLASCHQKVELVETNQNFYYNFLPQLEVERGPILRNWKKCNILVSFILMLCWELFFKVLCRYNWSVWIKNILTSFCVNLLLAIPLEVADVWWRIYQLIIGVNMNQIFSPKNVLLATSFSIEIIVKIQKIEKERAITNNHLLLFPWFWPIC